MNQLRPNQKDALQNIFKMIFNHIHYHATGRKILDSNVDSRSISQKISQL